MSDRGEALCFVAGMIIEGIFNLDRPDIAVVLFDILESPEVPAALKGELARCPAIVAHLEKSPIKIGYEYGDDGFKGA